MIFESHAHYDDSRYDEDREELLASLRGQGIGAVVNVGASFDSCKKTIALTREHEFIYGALGIHPSEVPGLDEEEVLSWIWEKSHLPKIVAIGEIGLDYHDTRDGDVRQRQKHWFLRQLDVAKEAGLPVIIHSRDAAEDTLNLMREAHAEQLEGVVHCFSYSREMAEAYLDMGYYIGIGGVVTFKNASKVKEVAREIPLDRLLLETDCPYLAPEPNRGTRNSSLNLPYVAQEIARLRGITREEVEEATWENAARLFRKAAEAAPEQEETDSREG